jgi:hypothetical protein
MWKMPDLDGFYRNTSSLTSARSEFSVLCCFKCGGNKIGLSLVWNSFVSWGEIEMKGSVWRAQNWGELGAFVYLAWEELVKFSIERCFKGLNECTADWSSIEFCND